MATKFGSNIGSGGGDFFDPKQYGNALALLIEPKKYREDVPNPKFNSTRDICDADVTIFVTERDFDGEPKVLTGCAIAQTFLAKDLKESIGLAEIARLDTRPNPNGGNPSWVWRNVPNDVRDQVIAYVERRDAEVDAALASDDVPDFLKPKS